MSKAFREVADVFKGLENAGSEYEFTTAQANGEGRTDEGALSVEVDIEVPFFDTGPIDEETKVGLADIRVSDDGVLQAKLLASVDCGGANAGVESGGLGSASEASEPMDGGGDPEKTSAVARNLPVEAQEHSDTGRESSEESSASETGAETSGEAPPTQDSTRESEDELPTQPYQDPEQLRKVYDEYDTFAEMTDALGVDVTQQTVRRYMIKHGIHEPSSGTGSEAAAALIDSDPDIISASSDEQRTSTETSPNLESSPSGDRNPTDGHVQSEAETDGGPSTGETEWADETKDATKTRGTEEGKRSDESGNPDETERVPDGGNGFSIRYAGTDPIDSGQTELASDVVDERITPEGVELPVGRTLDEVKDAVRLSNTLYECRHQLDLDRDDTIRLLKELNVLDFVYGRLTSKPPNLRMNGDGQ